MQSRWKSIGLTAIASLIIVGAGPGASAQVTLPESTKVQVVFEQDVSSKYAEPGDKVPIRLLGDVDIGGVIVIKDGARGSALVKTVKPAGRAGKPGSIEVELVELEPNGSYQALGDQRVRLRATGGPITADGKGRKTLSYLFIFGLFIKGTQGEIPAETPITAEIAADIELEAL